MSSLGTLPGGTYSIGYHLNNLGQVVGTADAHVSAQRAFLYTPGVGMKDIGTLGGLASQAFGINDLGQVVGVSTLQGDNVAHTFLYQGGQMTDLNSLISVGSGWDLTQGLAINNDGVIVGDGIGPGSAYPHAFVARPVPEPSSLTLLCIGGAFLAGCWGWRRGKTGA
jgi:probable HAF family extracellular repeat protein